jgi:putative phosphonate metabolism protein
MTERFAIYYAPSATSPLWDRASAWLGRDSSNGQLFDGPVGGIERARLLNLTQSVNRYGFHATIKPPMMLAPGTNIDALRQALADFAATRAPVRLGQLRIASLDGFLALIADGENLELQDLAAHVVEHFEPFRAPLSMRDRNARASRGLTPRQEELLDGYGYPYVFDEFRFHMTLTDRLAEADHEEIASAARNWFGALLAEEVVLDRLVLYHEPEAGLMFRRLEDFKFGGAGQ